MLLFALVSSAFGVQKYLFIFKQPKGKLFLVEKSAVFLLFLCTFAPHFGAHAGSRSSCSGSGQGTIGLIISNTKLYFCIDFLHVKPGKGNTIMRTTLKDVVSGRVLEKRFNIGEALEDVRVERRPYQFLYMEGSDYIFMNQETFDQIPIARDLITGVVPRCR